MGPFFSFGDDIGDERQRRRENPRGAQAHHDACGDELRRGRAERAGLAKGLDLIGDRWTLLIVRELLIQQPCRYTDLRYGLPGIATNLLATRLRELEENGIIKREHTPPPVARTPFSLTKRGEELKPVLAAIGRWGAPFLSEVPGDADFRSHWLALPLQLSLIDRTPDEPPATIQVHTGEQPMVIEVEGGRVDIWLGTAERADLAVSGAPLAVLGVVIGELDVDTARDRGAVFDGDPKTLRRVQPDPRLAT